MIGPIGNSLERYLDLLSLRQRLVASNIANADTPGYRTRDVDFASAFRAALDGGSPAVNEVAGLETRHDGNNVSLDREARLLSENALRFQVASGLLKAQLRTLRDAIQEGRSA